MICDYHLHTLHSGDSSAPVSAQIEAALALGMKELCITDHHDYDSGFCDINFELDIPAYLKDLEAAREAYSQKIQVRTGIELGLMNHLKPYLEDLVRSLEGKADFILGSSHFVGSMDPYEPKFWEGREESQAFQEYLEVSLERVKNLSSCFDVYGHLDYVLRYAPHQGKSCCFRQFQDIIDEILKTLIQNGKGLECNSGGLKYGLGQPNPSWDILKRYRQLGGEILTVGSDAHEPKYIGYGFEECRKGLLDCGFRYYTVFRCRRPVFLPL